MRWKPIYLLLGLLVLLAGCDLNRVDPEDVDLGDDYYPVEVGNYWDYRVFEVEYLPLTVDTLEYYLREQIAEYITSDEEDYYVLHRYEKENWEDAWVLDSAWKLTLTPSNLVVQRNNLQELDLIFPLEVGDSWDVNSFNTQEEDLITIQDQLSAYQATSTDSSFSDVIQLGFPEVDNAINVDNRKRYYARGIGLVHQYEEVTEDQPQQDLFGYLYEAVLVSYGKED